MAWMYILQCRNGNYYTGSTAIEVEARVWEHNNDDDRAANFTRKNRPVRLVYAEEFASIDDAFAREKQVQGWSRAKKLALITYQGQTLPALSRGRSGPSTSSGTDATSSGTDATSSGTERPTTDGR